MTDSQNGGIENEVEIITFRVGNLRRFPGKKMFALLDVEMTISGVLIIIKGVQARRLATGGVGIQLPSYKDQNGMWKQAIVVPEVVNEPLGRAMLDFLQEEGVIAERFLKNLKDAT